MMKSLAFILMMVLGWPLMSQSQGHSQYAKNQQNLTAEERAKKEADKAESKLGLNADQKTKWQHAALSRANANEPLRTRLQGSTTPEERKEIHGSMKKNNEQFENEIAQFLSSDQLALYQKEKQEHKGKGRHGGRQGQGAQ